MSNNEGRNILRYFASHDGENHGQTLPLSKQTSPYMPTIEKQDSLASQGGLRQVSQIESLNVNHSDSKNPGNGVRLQNEIIAYVRDSKDSKQKYHDIAVGGETIKINDEGKRSLSLLGDCDDEQEIALCGEVSKSDISKSIYNTKSPRSTSNSKGETC